MNYVKDFKDHYKNEQPFATVLKRDDGEEFKCYTPWNICHETQYIVGSKGTVARVGKLGRYKEIKIRLVKGKYASVSLSGRRDGTCQAEQITLSLPKLVAEVFIPNPYKACTVSHKDGDTLNCSADNLEWKVPQGSLEVYKHSHKE